MIDTVRHTIAVVDDDFRMLESIDSLLESAGHEVRLFSSAEEFIDADILGEIDCLVSDIGMSGIDGLELFWLAQKSLPDLPVILITGREELTSASLPPSFPPMRFFLKPFDGKKLLSVVAEAIGGRL